MDFLKDLKIFCKSSLRYPLRVFLILLWCCFINVAYFACKYMYIRERVYTGNIVFQLFLEITCCISEFERTNYIKEFFYQTSPFLMPKWCFDLKPYVSLFILSLVSYVLVRKKCAFQTHLFNNTFYFIHGMRTFFKE